MLRITLKEQFIAHIPGSVLDVYTV